MSDANSSPTPTEDTLPSPLEAAPTTADAQGDSPVASPDPGGERIDPETPGVADVDRTAAATAGRKPRKQKSENGKEKAKAAGSEKDAAKSKADAKPGAAGDKSPDGTDAANAEAEDNDDDLLDETLPIPKGDQAKAVLESLLFSATSPLSEKRLCNLMNGIGVEALRETINLLRLDYAGAGRGITIMEVAGGYQLATRQEFADWVFRLHKHRKRSALTPAVIETLAIVAYKQPIVRADIEAIRGVDCGGILRQLQDSGLVDVVGRKEVAGRPPLYGTSDLFLKSFGLKRLSDLPAIEELHSILAQDDAENPRRPTAPPPTGAKDAAATDVKPAEPELGFDFGDQDSHAKPKPEADSEAEATDIDDAEEKLAEDEEDEEPEEVELDEEDEDDEEDGDHEEDTDEEEDDEFEDEEDEEFDDDDEFDEDEEEDDDDEEDDDEDEDEDEDDEDEDDERL